MALFQSVITHYDTFIQGLQSIVGSPRGYAAVATAYAAFFGLWVVPKSSKRSVTASIFAHRLLQCRRSLAEQILTIHSAIHLKISEFFDGDGGYVGLGTVAKIKVSN